MTPLVLMTVQMRVTTDLRLNLPAILNHIDHAGSEGVDFMLFPEGALSGYHPNTPQADIEAALAEIADATHRANVCALVGASFHDGQTTYNQVRAYDVGKFIGAHSKTIPTGGDLQWTTPGGGVQTFETRGLRFGMLICNDLWCTPPSPLPDQHLVQQLVEGGAEIVFHAINSGFDQSYLKWHTAHLETYARIHKVSILTSNAASDQPVNCPTGLLGHDGTWLAQAETVGDQILCVSWPT